MKLVRLEKVLSESNVAEYYINDNYSVILYQLYNGILVHRKEYPFVSLREAIEYVTYNAHQFIAAGYLHIGPFFEVGRSYRINDVVYTVQCVVESVFGHLAWVTFPRKVSGATEVQTMGFPSYLEATEVMCH